MTQCISLHASDKGFPNRGGRIPLSGGGWEILLGESNLYDGELHTPVHTEEYEVKMKV